MVDKSLLIFFSLSYLLAGCIAEPTDHQAEQSADMFQVVSKDNPPKDRQIKTTHDNGYYTTVCWTEITTIKENVLNGSLQAMKEYSIKFRAPYDIPEEEKDETEIEQTKQYEVFDMDTKKSKVLNFTKIEEEDNVITSQHRQVTCGSGPVFTKTLKESAGNKEIEIKVMPKVAENDRPALVRSLGVTTPHSDWVEVENRPSVAPRSLETNFEPTATTMMDAQGRDLVTKAASDDKTETDAATDSTNSQNRILDATASVPRARSNEADATDNKSESDNEEEEQSEEDSESDDMLKAEPSRGLRQKTYLPLVYRRFENVRDPSKNFNDRTKTKKVEPMSSYVSNSQEERDDYESSDSVEDYKYLPYPDDKNWGESLSSLTRKQPKTYPLVKIKLEPGDIEDITRLLTRKLYDQQIGIFELYNRPSSEEKLCKTCLPLGYKYRETSEGTSTSNRKKSGKSRMYGLTQERKIPEHGTSVDSSRELDQVKRGREEEPTQEPSEEQGSSEEVKGRSGAKQPEVTSTTLDPTTTDVNSDGRNDNLPGSDNEETTTPVNFVTRMLDILETTLKNNQENPEGRMDKVEPSQESSRSDEEVVTDEPEAEHEEQSSRDKAVRSEHLPAPDNVVTTEPTTVSLEENVGSGRNIEQLTDKPRQDDLEEDEHSDDDDCECAKKVINMGRKVNLPFKTKQAVERSRPSQQHAASYQNIPKAQVQTLLGRSNFAPLGSNYSPYNKRTNITARAGQPRSQASGYWKDNHKQLRHKVVKSELDDLLTSRRSANTLSKRVEPHTEAPQIKPVTRVLPLPFDMPSKTSRPYTAYPGDNSDLVWELLKKVVDENGSPKYKYVSQNYDINPLGRVDSRVAQGRSDDGIFTQLTSLFDNVMKKLI